MALLLMVGVGVAVLQQTAVCQGKRGKKHRKDQHSQQLQQR
jgi:hypothetical protein